MTVLFDTPVLVASVISVESHHGNALQWLSRAREARFTAAISQHALAETFSVTTRLPGYARVSPQAASQLIVDLASFLEVIQLEPADYLSAASRLGAAGLGGGIFYDMLHAIAAERCDADAIVTSNRKDFIRLPLTKPIEVIDVAIPPSEF